MSTSTLTRIAQATAILMALMIETGCGGGGTSVVSNVGSGGTGVISGAAIKGPLSNASVNAYAIVNGQSGAMIGSTKTDANGSYTMTVGSYAGPVMLQVSGGSYTEEATGGLATMAAGDVMSAVLPSMTQGANVSGIQITPITAMAQARAQQMPGGMTDANIAAANAAMGHYFSIGDITHVLPMNPLVPGSATGASMDARNYGMALAGMSQLAKSLNTASTSSLVTSLMSDASDGMMDGSRGTSAISMTMGGMMANTTMAPTTGTSGLTSAMTSFMGSTANRSGLTAGDMATMMLKITASGGKI
jgi:hypothetical protein